MRWCQINMSGAFKFSRSETILKLTDAHQSVKSKQNIHNVYNAIARSGKATELRYTFIYVQRSRCYLHGVKIKFCVQSYGSQYIKMRRVSKKSIQGVRIRTLGCDGRPGDRYLLMYGRFDDSRMYIYAFRHIHLRLAYFNIRTRLQNGGEFEKSEANTNRP